MSMAMNGYHVDRIDHEGFVEFLCTGVLTLEGFMELGNFLRMEMNKDPSVDKVFIDVSRAEIKIDTLQRFLLGEYISRDLLDLNISVLADASVIDKMVEDTAVNRGAALYITHDREDALSWLL